MKRTELKRSTKRIRKRSKTNSHPGENLKFRQSYARAHEVCELGQWLPDHFESGRSDETHHIVTGRVDRPVNLIRASWINHKFCEDFKADGRVVCLWIKLQKGELDPKEFEKVSRGVLLPGYILMQAAKIRNAWVRPLADELKAAFP